MHQNSVHPAAAVAADAIRGFDQQVESFQRRVEGFSLSAKGSEIPDGVAALEMAVERLTQTVAAIECRLEPVLEPVPESSMFSEEGPPETRPPSPKTTLGQSVYSAADSVDAMAKRLRNIAKRLAL